MDVLNTISQFGPGVATVGLVLYYLEKKDKMFTQTIKEIAKENSEALHRHTRETITEIHKHGAKIEEVRKISQAMYVQNAKLAGYDINSSQ